MLVRAVGWNNALGSASLAVTTNALPADDAPAAADNLSCMDFQIMGAQYTRVSGHVNTSTELSVHKIGTTGY